MLAHSTLLSGVGSIIMGMDRLVGQATFRDSSGNVGVAGGQTFQEVLLACIMIIGLAYATKVLEYVIFKLKA